MKLRIIAALAVLMTASVAAFAQNKTETIVVHHELVSCGQEIEKRCLSIKEAEARDWEVVQEDQIGNFKFTPGYTYILETESNADTGFRQLKRISAKIRNLVDTPRVSLEGSSWRLLTIRGQGIGNTEITMKLDRTNKRVFGNAGCNRFSGDYRKGNPGLSFTKIATTKMLCPAIVVESRFLRTFRKVTSYRLNGNNLFLYAGKSRVLEFEVDSANELRIEGARRNQ